MLNNIIKKVLKEATRDNGSRGSYAPPMQPGLRPFKKTTLTPFELPVSEYKSPLVQYDSYDGEFNLRTKQIKELEKTAKKVQNYIKRNPYSTFSDEDGNVINQFGSNKTISFKEKNNPFTLPINEWIEITDDLILEADSSTTAGLYNGPIEIGLKKWKNQLSPFTEDAEHLHNHHAKKSKLKDNVKKVVGVWEKNKDGTYHNPTHDAGGKKEKQINEDLAVWFGTKKKPKGSKQPKGPWVNICRKKEGGGHPPCGRPEAKSKGYPKCRAAGVAAKMSDSQKRAACAQKRRAEKTNPKLGTGNKPKMVSYKPKKKLKESNLDSLIKKVLRNY